MSGANGLLIVDDEPGIRQSLSAVLRDEGFHAEAVASGEECLATLQNQSWDVLLLDIWCCCSPAAAAATAPPIGHKQKQQQQ